MRKLSLVAAAIMAAVGIGTGAAQAQQVSLRMLSSWPAVFDYNPIIAGEFKRLVEERSKGHIAIRLGGPEVVPPFQQFEPLKSGVFDILFTTAAYHPNEIAIGLMADAMDPDPAKLRASGAFDVIADRYQKRHNIKVLGIASGASDAFQILIKTPVDPKENLQGRKIRGTSNYFGVIKALGGTPVVLPTTETYTALQKGVVDGSGQATIGVVAQRWYEVEKGIGRPAFGSMRLPILMNMASWNKLSKEDQQLLTDAARDVEISAHKAANDIRVKEAAELAKLGMSETQFGLSKAVIEQKWEEGLRELTQKNSPEEMKIWEDFLKGKKILRSEIY